MDNEQRRVQLVFFDAGGGHRAATEALKESLAERKPSWRVEVVNLQEVLKSADPLYIMTGVPAQDFYNAALKMGLTYGSRPFLRGLQAVIKLCAPRIENVLREHWRGENGKIDIVVSLIPNFNGVLFRSLQAERPHVPFVTIMTDMADTPPHFWQEKQDQYLVCGTDYAAQQARATGWYRDERIFRTSGMILRPSFYRTEHAPRLRRAELGLAEDKATAIVMFGGYGSNVAEDIVDRLNKAKLGVQCIVMCGRNESLRAELQGKENCAAIGYTQDVVSYMRLADFFIGKPGPGSMSEAWRMGLPVIVERNARTMIQERPNVTVAAQAGVGLAVPSFRSIAKVVRGLIDGRKLEDMRINVRKMDNRAVFEIPDILDRIMHEHIADAANIVAFKPRRRLAARIAQRWKTRRRKSG
ncbi:MAG: galactosyldiacylglycerol synthase [Alphaproteobacteria bacterium]|nr:galactosyldiacylglycerol synthase [Alphaproteobacteria bacterium]